MTVVFAAFFVLGFIMLGKWIAVLFLLLPVILAIVRSLREYRNLNKVGDWWGIFCFGFVGWLVLAVPIFCLGALVGKGFVPPSVDASVNRMDFFVYLFKHWAMWFGAIGYVGGAWIGFRNQEQ